MNQRKKNSPLLGRKAIFDGYKFSASRTRYRSNTLADNAPHINYSYKPCALHFHYLKNCEIPKSDLFGAIQRCCISLIELTVWAILLTFKNICKIVSLSDWCEILTDMWLRRVRSESFFGYRFFAVKEMVQLCSKPYKLYILYIFISIRYLTLIFIMYKNS